VLFRRIGSHITDADVVIADSSAWSHHAHPACDAPVICFCHSPARFLYVDEDYLGATSLPLLVGPAVEALFGVLRREDK
jgi:hypothetical protein